MMVAAQEVEKKKTGCPCWCWVLWILLGLILLCFGIYLCTRDNSDAGKNKNSKDGKDKKGFKQMKLHKPTVTKQKPNIDFTSRVEKKRLEKERDDAARKLAEERRRRNAADKRAKTERERANQARVQRDAANRRASDATRRQAKLRREKAALEEQKRKDAAERKKNARGNRLDKQFALGHAKRLHNEKHGRRAPITVRTRPDGSRYITGDARDLAGVQQNTDGTIAIHAWSKRRT